MKHTPGAWKTLSKINSRIPIIPVYYGDATDVIAWVTHREALDDFGISNAHLIAAAPELLKVLKEVYAIFEMEKYVKGPTAEVAERVLKAIAKAEGK